MRYGLVPTSWGPNGVVTSVKCRFCDVFKREERKPTSDNAKPRKKTMTVKYFKTFRPTCYKQHLETEHPAKWGDYGLPRMDEARETFFESSLVVPISQSLHAHFDISQDDLVVHLKPSIVDTIVGNLLFHPDTIGEVTHERALRLFKRVLVFVKLQEKLTLLSQQRAALTILVMIYARLTGMEGPLSSNDLRTIDMSRSEVCGAYVFSHACARKLLSGLDPWLEQTLECMIEEDAQLLFSGVGKMSVQAADGISSIVAERT
ncbi:hypothetical protein PHYPSEUDO_010411 [Phytophthora pseudosyringae]|uniref:Uncharacterized protein n=1 Tax=Phytophthora pseudosyringae TaxID=221518 RepID=A0A8T1VB88_9STRA|nr:hypothetical protein PHYPSEUDO_010411 [Phytophthora pseudosyringae]